MTPAHAVSHPCAYVQIIAGGPASAEELAAVIAALDALAEVPATTGNGMPGPSGRNRWRWSGRAWSGRAWADRGRGLAGAGGWRP